MEKHIYDKRIQVMGVILVVLTTLLGYKLFRTQILERNNYLVQAENQYTLKKDLPALRGNIYFSDMFPAATNTRYYQVVAVPKQIKDKNDFANKIAPLINTKESDLLSLIDNEKSYIPPLAKHLKEDDALKIADLKLKGLQVVAESLRLYPEGNLASQVLGFVDASGEGHYGIEGYFNNELKGIGGEIYGDKDTKGRLFDINSNVQPRNGLDFVLTVNHDIQYKVEQVLKESVERYKADSGSIVINDPKTGKILAMANFPTYDANEYNKVPAAEQNLFNNAAVSSPYEPGSVFKPLIMAEAINENKVQPDTENVFGSEITVNGYKIRTSTGEAYGRETMTEVLENSDNVAMVWISELLGRDSMYKYITNMGFNRKSGIELDSESSGELADIKKWSDVQRANISFGQGLTTTPLQVMAATGIIANKGRLMRPYIVEKTIDYSKKEDLRQPKEVAQVFTEDTAKKVTDMMVSVVVRGHGKKAAVEGYKVAGKTGTAQVPKPGGGYYDDRHVGSFVGFAPADDPKFAMIVRLDNPKNVDWAESSAAPTFGEIADWLLNYMNVPKDQELDN